MTGPRAWERNRVEKDGVGERNGEGERKGEAERERERGCGSEGCRNKTFWLL